MFKKSFTLFAIASLILTITACESPNHIKPKNEYREFPVVQVDTYQKLFKRIENLALVISKAEGEYDSINRGRAGDTPAGASGHFGKDLKDHTISEVFKLQSSGVHAVGRYQMIPKTLRFAVSSIGIKHQEKFNKINQDKLFASIIKYKRPIIYNYIMGKHDNINLALDEIAKEWASVEYRNGHGYYDGIGGNKAKISRDEIKSVLESVRV